jgi:hypothetical protein
LAGRLRDVRRTSADDHRSRDADWQEIGAMLNGMIDRAGDFCRAPAAELPPLSSIYYPLPSSASRGVRHLQPRHLLGLEAQRHEDVAQSVEVGRLRNSGVKSIGKLARNSRTDAPAPGGRATR